MSENTAARGARRREHTCQEKQQDNNERRERRPSKKKSSKRKTRLSAAIKKKSVPEGGGQRETGKKDAAAGENIPMKLANGREVRSKGKEKKSEKGKRSITSIIGSAHIPYHHPQGKRAMGKKPWGRKG